MWNSAQSDYWIVALEKCEMKCDEKVWNTIFGLRNLSLLKMFDFENIYKDAYKYATIYFLVLYGILSDTICFPFSSLEITLNQYNISQYTTETLECCALKCLKN